MWKRGIGGRLIRGQVRQVPGHSCPHRLWSPQPPVGSASHLQAQLSWTRWHSGLWFAWTAHPPMEAPGAVLRCPLAATLRPAGPRAMPSSAVVPGQLSRRDWRTSQQDWAAWPQVRTEDRRGGCQGGLPGQVRDRAQKSRGLLWGPRLGPWGTWAGTRLRPSQGHQEKRGWPSPRGGQV